MIPSPMLVDRPRASGGAGTLLVAQSFKSYAASSVTNPKISIGLLLKKADVASGRFPRPYKNTTPVAAGNYGISLATSWPDSSTLSCVLDFISPDSFASGDTVAYNIYSDPTAPTGTPPTMGSHNFRIKMYGGDLAALLPTDPGDGSIDWFEINANDIIANGAQGPNYGTNPLRMWDKLKNTGVSSMWRTKGFARRHSDNAVHRWLQGTLYPEVCSNGTAEVTAVVGNFQTYGAVTGGTVSGFTPPRVAVCCDVYDGSTLLGSAGGPNDSRTSTIASSAFNTSTKSVTIPGASDISFGTGVQFKSSGSLPAGLTAGTVYWPIEDTRLSTTTLLTNRAWCSYFQNGNAPSQWLPNTSQGYGTDYPVVYNNGIYYYAYPPGVSGSGSGPTGTGSSITDGGITWQSISQPFTTQGSSTITMTPMAAVFSDSQRAFSVCHTDGTPLWAGPGTQPKFMVDHDLAYLETTNLIGCYDQTITYYDRAGTKKALPNSNEQFFLWDQGTAGASPGDDRVGPLPETTTKAIITPFDQNTHQWMLAEAHAYWGFVHCLDETSGRIPVCNLGPSRDGTSRYTNMGATNSGLWIAYPATFGSPPYFGTNLATQARSGAVFRYAPIADASHMPVASIGALLKTGHPMWLDQLSMQAATVLASSTYPDIRNLTVNATKFGGIFMSKQQTRGIAWQLRLTSWWEKLVPTSWPEHAYASDVMDDNAAFAPALIATLPANASAMGIWNMDEQATVGPWNMSYFADSVYKEVLYGKRTGFGLKNAPDSSVADWASLMERTFSPMDSDLGGNLYYCSLYFWQSTTDGSSNLASCMGTVAGWFATNIPGGHAANTSGSCTGAVLPGSDPAEDTGQFGVAGYPYAADGYLTYFASSMALGAKTGRAFPVKLNTRIKARIAAAGGIVFSQPTDTVAGGNPTWTCVA